MAVIATASAPPGLRRGGLERRAAARHDAMDVRMMEQGLAPGMQHGDHAELGAEVAGVGGDHAQCLGRRSEQDGVDRRLVLEGDLRGCRRNGEDEVEVFHRQQFGLTGGEPLGAGLALALRAVLVAAGIVGVTDAAALPAVLDMAAECRRAA